MSFIVAVDGPAGSGKGTVTKKIAQKLDFINLDTGATYRCLALEVLRKGIDLNNEEKIIELANNIDIKIDSTKEGDIVYLNGEDVTKKIRQENVTKIVSQVSAIIPVRTKMVELQRNLSKGKKVIVEGRDIGTVVFPNANLKIYLDASSEVRAKRRQKQNEENGITSNYEEVLKQIIQRDNNDKNKKVGALKKADDAVLIDTSEMTIEEVVDTIEKLILTRQENEK